MTVNKVMLIYGKEIFEEIYDDFKDLKIGIANESSEEITYKSVENNPDNETETESSENPKTRDNFISSPVDNKDIKEIMSAYNQIKLRFARPDSDANLNCTFPQKLIDFFRENLVPKTKCFIDILAVNKERNTNNDSVKVTKNIKLFELTNKRNILSDSSGNSALSQLMSDNKYRTSEFVLGNMTNKIIK